MRIPRRAPARRNVMTPKPKATSWGSRARSAAKKMPTRKKVPTVKNAPVRSPQKKVAVPRIKIAPPKRGGPVARKAAARRAPARRSYGGSRRRR